MGGGVQPIPRAEKLQAKMNKIDKVFHREIENRRLQSSAIQDFRRMFGLAGGKINGEKEMQEIADLEDGCVVKMR